MRSLLVAVTAVLCTAPALAQSSSMRPVASVESGKVRGTEDDGAITFRGIPYAAPPVGERRWRAPAPAARWQGVRDAARFGAACPQPPGRTEAWAQVGPTSEDCLFLNVWRPTRPGRYPVMVFIHGGGFTYGAAGVPLYDGATLARRGVVVVTINYRLGLLGFFAHPALTRETSGAALGNYGIMDQIAALRWVRRNIAAFAGDTRNITAFGESAGAGSIQLLMGSPEGRGLFEKAISESGAGGTVLPSFRVAEAMGRKAIDAVGLGDATAAQLRALPIDRLLKRSFPFIDGKIIVASPGTAFHRGRQARIPLLIGSNSNEVTLFGKGAGAAAVKLLGETGEPLERDYLAARPKASPEAAGNDLAEDVMMVLPSVSIAALHAAAGAPAYVYHFDQVPASVRAASAGAGHGDEVQYVFGAPYDEMVWDDADRAVAQATGDYWIRFARTGDPNGKGTVVWPTVGGGTTPRYLMIGTPIRAAALTPLEERARAATLAVSWAGWKDER